MLIKDWLVQEVSMKKKLVTLIVMCLLLSDIIVFANPGKSWATAAASAASKEKTLRDFGKLSFQSQIPQEIFSKEVLEEELKIQEKILAELRKVRTENTILQEKIKTYENVVLLAEQLSAAKDEKINSLEKVINNLEVTNKNNDKIIENLKTQITASKEENKLLKEELDKVKKTRNKRAGVMGLIGLILGIAAKAILF